MALFDNALCDHWTITQDDSIYKIDFEQFFERVGTDTVRKGPSHFNNVHQFR